MMGATRFRPRSHLWEFLALGLYAEATSRGKRNEWTSYLFIVRRETLWLACAVKVATRNEIERAINADRVPALSPRFLCMLSEHHRHT